MKPTSLLTVAALTALAGCVTAPPPAAVGVTTVSIAPPAPTPPPPAPPHVPPASVSPALQATTWSFGAGETAALSHQAFGQMLRYVRDELPKLRRRTPYSSAILSDDASAARRCTPATQRRPAVIFDVDETILLNIGHQYDQTRLARAYDPAVWSKWEREGVDLVEATPGSVAALQRLRTTGVAVLFVSNRSAENAAFTVRAIDRAGLGPAVHRDTLWLQGDLDPGTRKNTRRLLLAKSYCVIALVGDQMGDFTDAIDYPPGAAARRPLVERRAAADTLWAARWGRGWFVLPNPMYGSWNTPTATLDGVVPPNYRWSSTGEALGGAPETRVFP